jgi:hypothetical protein
MIKYEQLSTPKTFKPLYASSPRITPRKISFDSTKNAESNIGEEVILEVDSGLGLRSLEKDDSDGMEVEIDYCIEEKSKEDGNELEEIVLEVDSGHDLSSLENYDSESKEDGNESELEEIVLEVDSGHDLSSLENYDSDGMEVEIDCIEEKSKEAGNESEGEEIILEVDHLGSGLEGGGGGQKYLNTALRNTRTFPNTFVGMELGSKAFFLNRYTVRKWIKLEVVHKFYDAFF